MRATDFEKLYRAYYMQVYSYLVTLVKNPSLAEEITQETFFRAFKQLNSFRGEADEVTWLCAIARNLFSDEKRRQGRAAELDEMMRRLQGQRFVDISDIEEKTIPVVADEYEFKVRY